MHRELYDLVNQSLKKARNFRDNGCYGHAYAHYTLVVELCRERRQEVEEEFTDVLCKWGMELEKTSAKKTLTCYQHSLDIYPTNPRMLNNCAAHYLRQDLPKHSVAYLKRALAVDPDFLPAQWNLHYAQSLLVDRWHFPMLNDRQRNLAYQKAIKNRVKQGFDTVLDIGSGTGLLSLYAKDANAREIYACECLEEVSIIAQRVLERNNASEIKLLPVHSTNLYIPQHLPSRLRLVVTETFDTGLFGEKVLSTMVHAHENLLLKPGKSMVIPMAASLFVAAVESEQIRFKSSFHNLPRSSLNFTGLSALSDTQFYDTVSLEYLSTKYLTPPTEILRVDFTNVAQLRKLQSGTRHVMDVTCTHDGRIDGLITWFRLYLDEEIFLDTSHPGSCWQHAVFPVEATPSSCGDILTISALINDEKLTCTFSNRSKETLQSLKITPHRVYHVPQEVVAFLNDPDYSSAIIKAAKYHPKPVNYVFDSSPFPVFGLELLKRNLDAKTLFCCAKTPQLAEFIRHVAQISGIEVKIQIVESIDSVDVGLDVIFEHNFTSQGEIKDWDESSRSFHSLQNILLPDGVILPRDVALVGALGYSQDLENMVLVNDDNLGKVGYTLAEFINEYACKQRFDLSSNLYRFEALSDSRELLKINRATTTSESVVSFGTFCEKLPNVLLCWYNIWTDDETIITSRRSNSFMNHSAIILQGEDVNKISARGDELRFKILQMKGLTRITLIK